MNLDLSIGDVVLGGKFKNKRIEVKSIGEDEIGQPIINEDRKLLAVRIEKKLPEGMWSSASLAKKYKEKNMDKQAVLEEIYKLSFDKEIENIVNQKLKKYKGSKISITPKRPLNKTPKKKKLIDKIIDKAFEKGY